MVTFLRKRLNHVKGIQFFLEISRDKLCAPIRVKYYTLRTASVPDSVLESVKGEKSLYPDADPVSNDLPGKQIQNDTLDTGKIADSNQIVS